MRTVMDNLLIGVAVNSVNPEVEFEYVNENFARFYRVILEDLKEPDAFWDKVYENSQFREQIRKQVLVDCANGDIEK